MTLNQFEYHQKIKPVGVSTSLYPTGNLQSLSVSVQKGLDQTFVLRYGLQDLPVCCDVPDGPLSQPGAGEPKHITSRLVYVLLQSRLDFVVRKECYITWMSYGQDLPVSQQSGPRLKQPATKQIIKFSMCGSMNRN